MVSAMETEVWWNLNRKRCNMYCTHPRERKKIYKKKNKHHCKINKFVALLRIYTFLKSNLYLNIKIQISVSYNCHLNSLTHLS